MKKTIIAIISALFLLSGCGGKAVGGSEGNRVISWFTNVGGGGELYSDSRGRLHFYDFSSMTDVYICPNPNCTHNDPKSCSSYGMDGCPILYGDNIYFFENSIERTDNGAVCNSELFKANTDGTSRVKMAELEGLSVGSMILLLDGKIYFCPEKREFTDTGNSTNHGTVYLYSYDFSENRFTELKKIVEGYSCNTWIFGEFGGDIYLNYSYSENEYDYTILFDENAESPFTIKNAKFSLESGEIEELDYTIDYISGGYLFTSTDSKSMTITHPDGKETTAAQFGDVSVLNGYVFDRMSLSAYEISTGKSFKLKTNDKMAEVIDFNYGEYILRKYTDDGRVYSKVAEADLIEDEVE